MVRDLRIKARETGDEDWVAREEAKRTDWRWENSLRRHNFVGFTGEVLKGVVEAKVREGKYESWVEDAKARTQKKVEERKKGGGGAEVDEMEL